MALEEGTKGRISHVKHLEYQKGVVTPSIGLAYTPTLKLLHIPTSTLIVAQKNFQKDRGRMPSILSNNVCFLTEDFIQSDYSILALFQQASLF